MYLLILSISRARSPPLLRRNPKPGIARWAHQECTLEGSLLMAPPPLIFSPSLSLYLSPILSPPAPHLCFPHPAPAALPSRRPPFFVCRDGSSRSLYYIMCHIMYDNAVLYFVVAWYSVLHHRYIISYHIILCSMIVYHIIRAWTDPHAGPCGAAPRGAGASEFRDVVFEDVVFDDNDDRCCLIL